MSHPYLTELHETLLRVAGWLPDDVLANARSRLAAGRCGEVARILTFAGARIVLPLTDDDVDLLGDLLEQEGADTDALTTIELAADYPPLLWQFSEAPPETSRNDEEIDGYDAALTAILAEDALVSAMADEVGARGLWCAWRTPVDGAPYPLPRLVYVVEVDDEAGELAELTGRLQHKLTSSGERAPQVEVVSMRGSLPSYQLAARGQGMLLWAATPEPEIKRLETFDVVDPEDGPNVAPDRP
jgi:hypothetical protein